MSGSSGLIKERTTIIFSNYTPEQLETSIDKIVNEMARIKKESEQEAMTLEINGVMYLI